MSSETPRRLLGTLLYTSLSERLLASIGGGLGILAILWITQEVLDQQGAAMLAASMGATAVLLFAIPHSPFSQPWPVFGGHMLGALVGVSCAHFLSDPLLAAPLAMVITVTLMYSLRCQHPPGAATAMIAVLGGESVHGLGYGFLLTPVLENILILLLVAVLFNLPFPWRRYPARFAARHEEDQASPPSSDELTTEDITHALEQIDTYLDISKQDLQHIYCLAQQHRHSRLNERQQSPRSLTRRRSRASHTGH